MRIKRHRNVQERGRLRDNGTRRERIIGKIAQEAPSVFIVAVACDDFLTLCKFRLIDQIGVLNFDPFCHTFVNLKAQLLAVLLADCFVVPIDVLPDMGQFVSNRQHRRHSRRTVFNIKLISVFILDGNAEDSTVALRRRNESLAETLVKRSGIDHFDPDSDIDLDAEEGLHVPLDIFKNLAEFLFGLDGGSSAADTSVTAVRQRFVLNAVDLGTAEIAVSCVGLSGLEGRFNLFGDLLTFSCLLE